MSSGDVVLAVPRLRAVLHVHRRGAWPRGRCGAIAPAEPLPGLPRRAQSAPGTNGRSTSGARVPRPPRATDDDDDLRRVRQARGGAVCRARRSRRVLLALFRAAPRIRAN